MKIRTSITINLEDADYIIEISEDYPAYTTVKEKDDKTEKVVLTIPNKELTEFIEALIKHKQIHGL